MGDLACKWEVWPANGRSGLLTGGLAYGRPGLLMEGLVFIWEAWPANGRPGLLMGGLAC